MAEDDDTIYVDVAAKLDENVAEREVGKLRDKFKNAGKSIGNAFGTDVGQELGQALRARIPAAVEGLGKTIGSAIGGDAGSEIGRAIGAALGRAGSSTFGEYLKDVTKSANDLKSAFADLKAGDTKKGLDGLSDSLKNLGVNAKDLPGPLGQAADKAGSLRDKFHEVKGDLKDFVETMGAVAALAPGWAGALAKVATPLGEIAGSLAAVGKVEGWLKDLPGGVGNFFQENLPDAGNALSAPFKDIWDYIRHPSHIMTGPSDPSAPGNKARAMPPGAGVSIPVPDLGALGGTGASGGESLIAPGSGIGGAGAGTAGFASGGGIHATLADYTHPDTPDISTPSDIPAAAGGVRNLYAVAESLQGTPYSMALRNDCSGMVSKLANAALGLPPVASFSTANEGQWLAAHGFRQGVGGPGDLNIGWHEGGPGGGHTAATLPGGVNAESGGSVGSFALGGPTGAFSPQFENHMFLPMGAGSPGAGGGFGVRPAGFGVPGLGGGGMGPLPPPTQPNTGQGGPIQQQHLGQGSGAGVSGGGLIGAAEQAGVAAASVFGFGAGGIAAQAAEQELNLAVQKGSQLAWAAAAAPMETLWLQGGMMGAPSVTSPAFGWPGKLAAGLIGSQYSSPNTAGAVQPPKDQKQGQQGEQQDPANGNQSQGPSGSKDDPIHTKSADGPPQQPQGAATSAANMTATMAPMTA